MEQPFSPFAREGNLVFTSGQGPVDMARGVYTPADFDTEARLTLDNLRRVLEQAGASMEDVLRVTIFLASIDDYDAFNRVYLEYFHHPLPARACLASSGLAFGMKLELEAIARVRRNG